MTQTPYTGNVLVADYRDNRTVDALPLSSRPGGHSAKALEDMLQQCNQAWADEPDTAGFHQAARTILGEMKRILTTIIDYDAQAQQIRNNMSSTYRGERIIEAVQAALNVARDAGNAAVAKIDNTVNGWHEALLKAAALTPPAGIDPLLLEAKIGNVRAELKMQMDGMDNDTLKVQLPRIVKDYQAQGGIDGAVALYVLAGSWLTRYCYARTSGPLFAPIAEAIVGDVLSKHCLSTAQLAAQKALRANFQSDYTSSGYRTSKTAVEDVVVTIGYCTTQAFDEMQSKIRVNMR